MCRGKSSGLSCGGGSVDADGSPVCAGANAPLLSLQMKTVLAALSGRLVPWVNLKAKVWCLICGCGWESGAQVQNAPLLSLQMKTVLAALPADLCLG